MAPLARGGKPLSSVKFEKVQCLRCGDIIQSRWSGEWVPCMCGATFVDSTEFYTRYGYSPWEDDESEELSPYEVIDE